MLSSFHSAHQRGEQTVGSAAPMLSVPAESRSEAEVRSGSGVRSEAEPRSDAGALSPIESETPPETDGKATP